MPSKQTKCDKCGARLQISSWPFCPHGSSRGQDAELTKPIIVYQDPSDPSKTWNPGIDTPARIKQAPKGYQRVELKTQRERDKWEKQRGQVLGVAHQLAYKQLQSEHSSQQRDMLERLKAIPCTTPQEKEMRAMVERRISESRGVARPQHESYIEVNHYDQGNRDGHRGGDGKYRKE